MTDEDSDMDLGTPVTRNRAAKDRKIKDSICIGDAYEAWVLDRSIFGEDDAIFARHLLEVHDQFCRYCYSNVSQRAVQSTMKDEWSSVNKDESTMGGSQTDKDLRQSTKKARVESVPTVRSSKRTRKPTRKYSPTRSISPVMVTKKDSPSPKKFMSARQESTSVQTGKNSTGNMKEKDIVITERKIKSVTAKEKKLQESANEKCKTKDSILSGLRTRGKIEKAEKGKENEIVGKKVKDDGVKVKGNEAQDKELHPLVDRGRKSLSLKGKQSQVTKTGRNTSEDEDGTAGTAAERENNDIFLNPIPNKTAESASGSGRFVENRVKSKDDEDDLKESQTNEATWIENVDATGIVTIDNMTNVEGGENDELYEEMDVIKTLILSNDQISSQGEERKETETITASVKRINITIVKHEDSKPTNPDETELAVIENDYSVENDNSETSDKGTHVCKDCGKCYTSTSHLSRHRAVHMGRIFECPTCGKHFVDRSNLKQHQLIHERKHLCAVCEEEFATKPELTIHRREVHSEKPTNECDKCDKKFSSGQSLRYHMQTHMREASKCDKCNKTLRTPKLLALHRARCPSSVIFQCQSCNKTFTKKAHLQMHEKSVHKGERNFLCKVCSKAFFTHTHLKTHSYLHTGERPYTCDVCAKGFTSITHLKRHKFLHTGERPFKCSVCQKAFTDNGSLKKHAITHTDERKYVCEVCGNAFQQSSILKKHMYTHTGEKRHQCDICFKRFTISGNLVKHRRIHTGERPYTCEFCGKSYSDRSHLTRHRRHHTGVKPYTCEVCGRGFGQTHHLKTHLRTHIKPEAIEEIRAELGISTDPAENVINESDYVYEVKVGDGVEYVKFDDGNVEYEEMADNIVENIQFAENIAETTVEGIVGENLVNADYAISDGTTIKYIVVVNQ